MKKATRARPVHEDEKLLRSSLFVRDPDRSRLSLWVRRGDDCNRINFSNKQWTIYCSDCSVEGWRLWRRKGRGFVEGTAIVAGEGIEVVEE